MSMKRSILREEPPTLSSLKPMSTAYELAEFLGIGSGSLNAWRCSGGGPRFVRVGRAIRYRRDDVQLWLDARTGQTTSQLSASMSS